MFPVATLPQIEHRLLVKKNDAQCFTHSRALKLNFSNSRAYVSVGFGVVINIRKCGVVGFISGQIPFQQDFLEAQFGGLARFFLMQFPERVAGVLNACDRPLDCRIEPDNFHHAFSLVFFHKIKCRALRGRSGRVQPSSYPGQWRGKIIDADCNRNRRRPRKICRSCRSNRLRS